jgi:4-hydroxy-3-polyprenylbenzoate decarboxylase
MHEPISLAWTGASGAPYGMRLLECLLREGHPVFLMVSSAARVVLKTEQAMDLPAQPERATDWLNARLGVQPGLLRVCGREEWFAPVASGSAAPRRMVVCPCSTGTLSAIATGASNNLIERAADVVLKERGQLIVVPREMPFSTLHLQNMLRLSELGATVMPACPGFYQQPQSIDELVDFVVARILDHLNIRQQLMPRWGYGPESNAHD